MLKPFFQKQRKTSDHPLRFCRTRKGEETQANGDEWIEKFANRRIYSMT